MSVDIPALLRALDCVWAFFIIGLIGYLLAKKGWFTRDSAEILAHMVAVVVIPIGLFYNINVSTTAEQFLPVLHHMFIPTVSIFLAMLLAAGIAKVVGMIRSHRNIFITAASCSNTINIGLPVNLILFGSESLPAVLLYYMGNTIAFWTVGNYLLASDAEGGITAPLISLETVKRMFSPAVLAFLAGLALLLLDVKIPSVLAIAGGHVAAMITPLSILCIGIAIFHAGLANIRFSRDVALIAFGRFVASPIILILILYLFPLPMMTRNVFIIQASLPPMTTITLLAMRYKSDVDFASTSISLCTLCALATVPIFMILISMMG